KQHPRPASRDEIARLSRELDDLIARLGRYETEQARRRHEIQQRLALVLQEIDDGVLLVDRRKQVLAINHTARRILGVDDNAVVDDPGESGGTAPRLAHAKLPAGLSALLDGASVSAAELADIAHGSGAGRRVYRPRAIPFTGDSQSTSGALVLFWDVTKEHALQQARQSFIATLSHQLKTPITSLEMAVNLLWERYRGRDPRGDELLCMARTDCRSVGAMIAELIEASRNTLGEVTLQREPLDIVDLTHRTLAPFHEQAKNRGVALVRSLPDEPVVAAVDASRYPWIVDNLVANALRFTPAGGRVEIAIARAGEHAVLSVADTGAGIGPEALARVFDPFTSERPVRGSLGLGLTIVKRLVEGHGGSIKVTSTPGQGSCFEVVLPVAPSRLYEQRGEAAA
ncbi:MAG: PAS domain-containing sensor histidine kinase, partial [Myxococcales bacterium]|nr:PAS domain-containing sensor histidine kinase [Myxococcales bacterium]